MSSSRLSVKSAAFTRGIFNTLSLSSGEDVGSLSNSTNPSLVNHRMSVDMTQHLLEKERQLSDVDSPLVFEKPLYILMGRRDHVDDREHVPKLVRYAVSALFNSTLQTVNKGLYKDGIFRESGSNTRIQELKQMFDEDTIEKHCSCQCITNPFDVEDPHVVTGMLKLYLRSLPEPVATFAVYEHVVMIMRAGNANDEMNVVRAMRPLIARLPELNKKLLNVILFILRECSIVNDKMKASNLGIVMGANIFRKEDTGKSGNASSNAMVASMQAMNDVQDLNKVVQIMIEHYYEFFTGEESYLYDVYPALRQRRELERCTAELLAELENPNAQSNSTWVNIRNGLLEKNQYDPLRWRVSESAIDEAVYDLKSLIDNLPDQRLQQQFEEVYARIYHSVYYCEDAVPADELDDDEDFKHGPVPYALLLHQKEDIWMREKKRLVTELHEEKSDNVINNRHTKRTLQRLLEQL